MQKEYEIWSKDVFARNLKYYMEREGKTQKEIAAIVGVSAPTFNEWLKAKKYPRIDKIERLAKYFGILKSDLIEDKKEMQKNNDVIVDIIARMRSDENFLSTVESLLTLDAEKLTIIKQTASAFQK